MSIARLQRFVAGRARPARGRGEPVRAALLGLVVVLAAAAASSALAADAAQYASASGSPGGSPQAHPQSASARPSVRQAGEDPSSAARLAAGPSSLSPLAAGLTPAARLLHSVGAGSGDTTPPLRTWTEALWIRCLPGTGTISYPAVIIDFTDTDEELTPAQLETLLNATDGFSVRGHYLRASYGALDLHADVLGVYHAPYPSTSVDTTVPDWERHLIEEAFLSFDAQGRDFAQYDHDGDGVIDYVTSFWTRPWYGYYKGFDAPGDALVDGVKVGAFSWLDQWTPGAVVHETGHALGLPDLYDGDRSTGPAGGVGFSDLMAGAAADIGAFGKVMLGWITPTVVSGGSQTVTLRPSARYADAAIVMPGYSLGRPRHEFFIVQARDATRNDAGTYASWGGLGLQIWHVDAVDDALTGGLLFNNTNTAHKLVRLMEADGTEDIEAGGDGGAGDLYRTGQSFGAATTPDSRPYWGTTSGVSVTDIHVGADSITCTLSAGDNDLDVTPPVTTASKAAGWYKDKYVQVGLSVSDDNPTWTRIRGEQTTPDWVDWDGETPLLAREGLQTLEFYSCDYAGNAEQIQRLEIGIDTSAPTTAALDPSVTVRRGRRVTLRLIVNDTFSPTCEVTVRILKGAALKKALALGARAVNEEVDYVYSCRLPRGRYVWQVLATDLAGNVQSTAGQARLIVR